MMRTVALVFTEDGGHWYADTDSDEVVLMAGGDTLDAARAEARAAMAFYYDVPESELRFVERIEQPSA